MIANNIEFIKTDGRGFSEGQDQGKKPHSKERRALDGRTNFQDSVHRGCHSMAMDRDFIKYLWRIIS
jgi:hypothetical protein